MTWFSASGWASKLGTVALRGGKLAVVGANYWNGNCSASYPGFNGYGSPSDTRFQSDSRRTLQAIVYWLTGKATGASILICETTGGSTWGTQLRDALTAASHSYTLTQNLTSWAGYEPLDYDCIFGHAGLSAFSYHGLATSQEKWDYVLGNGGAVLSESSVATDWDAYGISDGSGFHPTVLDTLHSGIASDGPPGWKYQRPFDCSPFGDPGAGGSWGTHYYALAMYSSLKVYPVTNQRGGTVTYYDCAPQSGAHVNPQTYVLALWTNE